MIVRVAKLNATSGIWKAGMPPLIEAEQYLFAAVVLTGLIQIAFGLLKLGKFIRLVPHPVFLGFVNGMLFTCRNTWRG
jgi:MFS superfamily sulfate permease-like transporter